MLVQVEIVQHDGAHVHELQRPPRHVDRERRPHAERRREQRQRRRGEAGRGRAAAGARFVQWACDATFWTRVNILVNTTIKSSQVFGPRTAHPTPASPLS